MQSGAGTNAGADGGARTNAAADDGRPVWRKLSPRERRILEKNGSTADNWDNLLVTDNFVPAAIRRCVFSGKNRIGDHTKTHLVYKGLRLPVGISDSMIISCDIGSNAAIHNVGYLSGYTIGTGVILFNIDEMTAVDRSDDEDSTGNFVWAAVANENGGRSVVLFSGMTTADAFLWSQNRNRPILQENLLKMTAPVARPGGNRSNTIGNDSVIKSCRVIENIEIGDSAYISGANKLKDLVVRSTVEAPTTVGEGVELEGGSIDIGCKIGNGVNAVRFCLGTNATLDHGARFIDSILGDNGKVFCCEVASSLLYPFHEQHHNNSFLIASTVQGQSDIGAGATLGSNHNSRAADCELFARRGFWPGLCANVKFPSRFASYCLLVKGSYPAELNIPLPFTLVSNNNKENKLQLYPGYWFMHNMYGLGRNSWKLMTRDAKLNDRLSFEYDYLAPDTIEELLSGLEILELWSDRYEDSHGHSVDQPTGFDSIGGPLYMDADGVERSSRGIIVLNVSGGYSAFREIIHYYCVRTLLRFMEARHCGTFDTLVETLGHVQRTAWVNLGGQLVTDDDYKTLLTEIENGTVASWSDVHRFYRECAKTYPLKKAAHALACLLSLHDTNTGSIDATRWRKWIEQSIEMQDQILAGTIKSRRQDFRDEFRKMMYQSDAEMVEVMGDPDDNAFIKFLEQETEEYKRLAQSFAV